MSQHQPNGDGFPGATVTLHLSAAQVAYLRNLLFEDLKEWADALSEQAHAAYESPGRCHGIDARGTYRRNVTPGLLDVIGWDSHGDVEAVRWLEQEARERLSSPE